MDPQVVIPAVSNPSTPPAAPPPIIPPPPPPVSTPPPLVPPPEPRRSWLKLPIKIALAILLMLLVGLGGGYAWAAFAPTSVLELATSRVANIDSYRADIAIQISSPSNPSLQIEGLFQMGVDQTNSDELRTSTQVSGTGMGLQFNVESKTIGTDTYIRINNLPLLVLWSGSEIAGKWFHISAKGFAGLASTTASAEEKEPLTMDQFLSQGLGSIVGSPLPVWGVNGPALRYEINLNKEKLYAYILEREKYIGSTSRVPPALMAEIWNSFTFSPAVYEVSLRHGIIDRLEFNFVVNFPATLKNMVSSTTLPIGGDETYNVNIQLVLSDINKPISIEVPGSSVPLQSLLGNILPQLMGSSSTTLPTNFPTLPVR